MIRFYAKNYTLLELKAMLKAIKYAIDIAASDEDTQMYEYRNHINDLENLAWFLQELIDGYRKPKKVTHR